MTNILNLIAFKDGEYKPLGEIGPSILDFGFIHCDATYDVMPVYNKKAFCYNRHLERFKNSARRYGFEIPDVDILEITKELIKLNNINDAFVWFILWRGFPPSGNPRDIANATTHFAIYVKPSYSLINKKEIKVYLDTNSYRVNDRYYGQEYKNMSWIDLTLAQRQVPKGYDTCVLIDDQNCITEGPGFNVGFVDGDAIKIPYRNCLKGITMSVVEDIATDKKIRFIKTDIPAEYWDLMDEIFLTSSSGGITPVKLGPMTELLIQEYEKRKADPNYATDI